MRVVTCTQIRCPIEEVFVFITTPAHWSRWHMSTTGVSGAIDHSLEVGEQLAEEFRIAGVHGQIAWTVRERLVPFRWTLAGSLADGKPALVNYTLMTQNELTVLEREFILDALVPAPDVDPTAWQQQADQEAAKAIERLRELLEERLPMASK